MCNCSRETPSSFLEADYADHVHSSLSDSALAVGPLWSQVDFSGALPAAVATDMVIPSPVNVEGTSLAFAAETERSNYLEGGLSSWARKII
jgi:hypothetical protein